MDLQRTFNESGKTRFGYSTKSFVALQRLFAGDGVSNDVPLTNLRQNRIETVATSNTEGEETERYLCVRCR